MAKYAQYYDYITGSGIIVPDTSTVLSDVQQEWRDVFGDNLSVDPETPQGRIIEMIARGRVFTIQMAAALSNVLNLNKAYGFVLDDLGSLFQLSRNVATYSTVQIQLNGVPGTIIPKGTELLSDNGDKFTNDFDAYDAEDYTIGAGGSVTALFRAEEPGNIVVLPDAIKTIITPVAGLETVNNPDSATVGAEQESDESFRNRIKASLNINSMAVLSAIKSAVANIDGVKQVAAYENTAATDFVLNDIFKVPGHGFGIVVDYSETEPGSQEVAHKIAEAIYKKKTLGAGSISANTPEGENYIVTIDYPDVNDSSGHNVSFAIPRPVEVATEITVENRSYSGEDLEASIKAAIANFLSGNNPEVSRVGIGEALSPFELAAAISSEIPEILIASVTIGRVGDPQGTSLIQLGEAEKLSITPDNITVNIL